MNASLKSSKAIAITTMGSLGDLHPCLALGKELLHRGHRVKIISTEYYRERIQHQGMEFCPMRPVMVPSSPDLIRQCDDLASGPEILFRDIILPHLHDTYTDLLAAAQGQDLLVASELVYAAPLVVEKLHLRWASVILSPCSFFSSHDPSVLVNAPWMTKIAKLGWRPYRAILNIGRVATRHWWKPVRELRKREGLRIDCDPLMNDKFSPELVLALFSSTMAKPQPDWPANVVQPGFIFHDERSTTKGNSLELSAFLSSGDPPIIFTLGSTAVAHPGNFYSTSIEAALRLGSRAIIIGAYPETRQLSPDILAIPYAPFSEVFPRASIIVHQGGIGTTAQALKAGRPMLVVPWGWDQPDNGERAMRLGTALCIPKTQYTVDRCEAALVRLRTDPSFASQTAEIAACISGEDGLKLAADSIEAQLF